MPLYRPWRNAPSVHLVTTRALQTRLALSFAARFGCVAAAMRVPGGSSGAGQRQFQQSQDACPENDRHGIATSGTRWA
jgi:hypothetical protein